MGVRYSRVGNQSNSQLQQPLIDDKNIERVYWLADLPLARLVINKNLEKAAFVLFKVDGAMFKMQLDQLFADL